MLESQLASCTVSGKPAQTSAPAGGRPGQALYLGTWGPGGTYVHQHGSRGRLSLAGDGTATFQGGALSGYAYPGRCYWRNRGAYDAWGEYVVRRVRVCR